MTNPSYGKCYPFENVDQQARETEWRHYGGAFGDGIVGPPRGDGRSAFSFVASTSDRSVVMNLADFRMRGIMFEPTQDTLTLSFPAIASGRKRADRLVAGVNTGSSSVVSGGATILPKSIAFYIKAGVDVADSATAARPSLTRTPGGFWEVGLWLASGGNVSASALTFEDHRIFLGDIMHGNEAPSPAGGNTELNLGRPDGSRFYHLPTGETWVQTYPGGIATWSNVDNPPWQALNIGTDLKARDHTPQYRIRRGNLELQGHTGPVAGPWIGGSVGSAKGLGVLPADVAARIGFPRRFTIALTDVSDTSQLTARGQLLPDGHLTFWAAPGLTIGGAHYDNLSFPLTGA